MKTILVIDDSPEIRELIQLSLEEEGFVVETAGDGREGVNAAQRHLPDLIICDLKMPVMDGYETLAAIRSNTATSMVPFIFLTGATEKNVFRKGMEMGADDFLNKPFTIEELYAAVNARLEKQAQVEEHSNKKLEALRGTLNLALPHELRTPLTGILGWSAMMIEDCEYLTPSEVQDYATQIQKSGQRLLRLIENFLAYGQIEWILRNPAKLKAMRDCAPLNIQSGLMETSKSIALRHSREADLTLETSDAHVAISLDHFKKLIEEILDNAFKFSKPQTPVTVTTQVESNKVTICVQDRGRGMTPDQIADIGPNMQFERKVYEQQGMGLGLIIAKRLTEAYDGAMTIESIPNRQTQVHMTFRHAVGPNISQ